MGETYVRLLCPECSKNWQSAPSKLPASDEEFACPDCSATRRTAEFTRTDRDLEALQSLG